MLYGMQFPSKGLGGNLILRWNSLAFKCKIPIWVFESFYQFSTTLIILECINEEVVKNTWV